MLNIRLRIIPPILFLFALILTYEGIRRGFSLPEIILPAPWEVLRAMSSEPRLGLHLSVTFGEAMAGFLVGNVLAIIAAIAFVRWPAVEHGLLPYALSLKTTPIVAIAPILIIWFGGGWASKAVAAASVCFFPTLLNATRGLRLIETPDYRDLWDLFRSWSVGWWRTLFYLRFPLSLPYIFAALKVSASLALVGAVVAEFVAADKGLGFLIVIYSRRLETASMFGIVIISALLSLAWFYAIVILERLCARRFHSLISREELL